MLLVLLSNYNDELDEYTGVLHDEPMARSDNSEEPSPLGSVGKARLSEMERTKKEALRYIVVESQFACKRFKSNGSHGSKLDISASLTKLADTTIRPS